METWNQAFEMTEAENHTVEGSEVDHEIDGRGTENRTVEGNEAATAPERRTREKSRGSKAEGL